MNSKSAEKAVVAQAIDSFNNREEFRQFLMSIAFEKIGDPAFPASWNITEDGFRNLANLLESCRMKVLSWINSQIIDYFFERVDMDAGRKAFWSKYASKIHHIQIAAHYTDTFDLISSGDAELATWIKSRLIKVIDETTDIALIMYFNEWAIIEIGTHGNACYLYHKTNPILEGLSRRRIYRFSYLKNPNLPFLNETNFYREGRLRHANGWQYTFRNVLSRRIGLKP